MKTLSSPKEIIEKIELLGFTLSSVCAQNGDWDELIYRHPCGAVIGIEEIHYYGNHGMRRFDERCIRSDSRNERNMQLGLEKLNEFITL